MTGIRRYCHHGPLPAVREPVAATCVDGTGCRTPLASTDAALLSAGMSDFNYLHTNCFEITVELGCTKFPPEEALYRLWQHNKEPLLSFLEMVRGALRATWALGVLGSGEWVVQPGERRSHPKGALRKGYRVGGILEEVAGQLHLEGMRRGAFWVQGHSRS